MFISCLQSLKSVEYITLQWANSHEWTKNRFDISISDKNLIQDKDKCNSKLKPQILQAIERCLTVHSKNENCVYEDIFHIQHCYQV